MATTVEKNPNRSPGTVGVLRDAGALVAETPLLVLLTVVSGGLLVVPVVGLILGLFVDGYAHVYAQRSRGEPPRTERSLPGRLLSLLVALLLSAVVVGIGFVFLILPGVYLLTRLWLFVPAVMLDGKGAVEALGTSWRRTGGNVLTVLGFLLVVFGSGAIASSVALHLLFGVELTALPSGADQRLVSGVVSGVFNAAIVAGTVLMYREFSTDSSDPFP